MGCRDPFTLQAEGFEEQKKGNPNGKAGTVLVTAAQKLKPYFQAHTIVVLTNKPLRRAMSSLEIAGRMVL